MELLSQLKLLKRLLHRGALLETLQSIPKTNQKAPFASGNEVLLNYLTRESCTNQSYFMCND